MADIPRGTVVAKIPRSALLTSVNSRVWSVLSNDKIFKRQLLKTKNSWIPLLIALITEYVYNKVLHTEITIIVVHTSSSSLFRNQVSGGHIYH